MKALGLIRRAIVIVTLCGFGLSQAEAIEIIGGPSPVAHMNDGIVLKAQVGQGSVQRGGARRGSAHRPVHHRPVHRPQCIALRSIAIPCIVRSTRSLGGASGLGRLGIGGLPAARSPPVRRSASSPRQPPPPGPARRRSRGCAGITPTPAGGRASGTSAHKPTARRDAGVLYPERPVERRAFDERPSRERSGLSRPSLRSS